MGRKVFLIAGEPSGDVLGASLMSSLRVKEHNIEIIGIGGDFMIAEGLDSLLPMDELCVMGLWEVLAHITRLKKLIDSVVHDVEKAQPEILVTIDLPDFNFRVAKKLKERGDFKGKIIHYGAPTVWAWRPKRAEKIAQFLDGLMCLFPFEPDYFTPHGLKTTFVGHPLSDFDKTTIQTDLFCEEYGINQSSLKIGLFLGSRPEEFKAMAPVLLESLHVLSEQYDDFSVIIPTLPHMEHDVTNITFGLPYPFHIVTDQSYKWDSFAACDVAIAVSGTVGLELSYIGVPHLIAYKVHPVSWVLLKMLIKTRYVHLANILMDKPIVPELLQWKCTAFHISKTLLEMIKKPKIIEMQKKELVKTSNKLRAPEGMKSSDAAALFVLGL